ncbi:preprotein translocase subunit YajC [Treponema sp.]|uniref:preprotein translocase subunit YajC n=1 Tax=Treponema sp. TaxID=166 RepID=UPI00298D8060|nr:preprotein translocase subunit YajC [Treponema sp.]
MSILNFLQSGTNGGSLTGSLVMIGLMIVIFYFFLIRPQKKQEKETKRMIDALKKGDKIVTIGGIYGTVFSVKDSTVVVKVDDSTKIEFTKTAISRVVTEAPAEAPAKAEEPAEEAEKAPAKKATAKKSTTKKASKAK